MGRGLDIDDWKNQTDISNSRGLDFSAFAVGWWYYTFARFGG